MRASKKNMQLREGITKIDMNEEERSGGKVEEKVNVRVSRAVWAYAWCYLLQKQMCFICQETGGSFYKSLFFTGETPVFTYKTLVASLAFLRLNLKQRFCTHTYTHVHAYTSAIRDASERETRSPDRRCVHSGYFCTPSLQADAGNSWKWRCIFCDTRLEICHFKVWVKRPLKLLIGLSSSITPVLCIAPFVRAATATNTLKSSSFDPP